MIAEDLIADATVTIDATAADVWRAITTPDTIKKYLMGTNVITNWKVGSPIEYEGEYNGKAYHDKGVIKQFEPGKLFQSTYWSSMSGKEDKPENYNTVTYRLYEADGKTTVTITQNNIHSEKEQHHAAENWSMVLKELKKVVEG